MSDTEVVKTQPTRALPGTGPKLTNRYEITLTHRGIILEDSSESYEVRDVAREPTHLVQSVDKRTCWKV